MRVVGIFVVFALLASTEVATATTDGQKWRWTVVGLVGGKYILFEKDNTLGGNACGDQWWSVFRVSNGSRAASYPIYRSAGCDDRPRVDGPGPSDWTAKQVAYHKRLVLKKHGKLTKIRALRIKAAARAKGGKRGPRTFQIKGKGIDIELRVRGRYPDIEKMNQSGNYKPAKLYLTLRVRVSGGKARVFKRRLAVASVPKPNNANFNRWPAEYLTAAAWSPKTRALALVYDRIPFVVVGVGK